MKYSLKALIVVGFLMFMQSAFALKPCHIGSWYDPDRKGEGINIEVINGLKVAYFYTFDDDGDQVWYTMIGEEIMTIMTTIKIYDDKQFITKTVDTGVAILEALTNDVIRFKFDRIIEYNEGYPEVCEGDTCSGEYIYRRITQPVPCE